MLWLVITNRPSKAKRNSHPVRITGYPLLPAPKWNKNTHKQRKNPKVKEFLIVACQAIFISIVDQLNNYQIPHASTRPSSLASFSPYH